MSERLLRVNCTTYGREKNPALKAPSSPAEEGIEARGSTIFQPRPATRIFPALRIHSPGAFLTLSATPEATVCIIQLIGPPRTYFLWPGTVACTEQDADVRDKATVRFGQ
jgi:hypothetical protein